MTIGGDLFGERERPAKGAISLPRPEGTVFFAIHPDPEAIAAAGKVSADLRSRFRLTEPAQGPEVLHVTLLHIGNFPELPETSIALACAAAQAVELPAFSIGFDSVATFDTRRERNPVVLTAGVPAPGAALLRQALLTEMRRRGLWYSRNAGRMPHMTLIYSSATLPAQPVVPLGWTAGEFALIYSRRGSSRHERLGSWKLRTR